MADTYTTNLNLTKPEPGAAEDTWGISLNADLDALDAIFSSSGTQINLNPNQVNFADNKKAVFGTGSDLEIYHDGSNSYIKEAGIGNLQIQATGSTFIKSSDGTKISAQFAPDSYTRLYHNNAKKLETTSTGIDVTGTVKASTSLMVGSTDAPARDLEIKTTNPHIRLTDTDASGGYTEIFGGSGITTINADKGQAVAGSVLKLSVDATDGLTINSNHNVDIPNGNLNVTGTVTSDALTVQTAQGDISIDNSSSTLNFARAGASYIRATNSLGHFNFITGANNFTNKRLQIASNGDISFYDDTGTTQGLFWDASAESLGIGTTSPSRKVAIFDSVDGYNLELSQTGAYNSGLQSGIVFTGKYNTGNNVTNLASIRGGKENTTNWDFGGNLRFYTRTNGGVDTERMRIDSSGSVGIGTGSPDAPLHISAATEPYIRIENTDTILTEGQVVGGLAFEQNDSTGGGTGITGRIQMRSADRPDNGSYFGNVADMDFLVSGASTGVASDNATKTAMTIRAGTGSVGIGTSSIDAKLHVESSSDTFLRVEKTGADNLNLIATGAGSRVRGSGDLIFDTGGGNERARIKGSNGYFGIGTTSPSEKLTVAGIVKSNGLSTNTAGVSNFIAGVNAGSSIISGGEYNTLIGDEAGASITTGDFNVAVGNFALDANTTSSENTAIGYASLSNNITGARNVASGFRALQLNTASNDNTATGYFALYSTTGSNNTAIGKDAGKNITTGSKNTIIGSFNGNEGGLDIRTANNHIVLSDGDGNPRQVIDSSGNVGIGTSSPTETLHVMSGVSNDTVAIISGSQSDRGLTISTYASDGRTDGGVDLDAYKSFKFTTDGTERVRIDSSGNFGINTSSPDALLEIDKGSEGEYLRVGGDNASNARSLRFTSSTASGSSVGALHTIKANSVGGEIAFANGNGNIMYLDVNRKVGIGTTAPGEKLTVSGNTLTYGSTGNVGAGASYFLGNSQNSRDIALTRVDSATLAIGYYSGGWQESARFDALGNLLVGTTSIAPYASTSSTAQGIALRGDLGFIGVSRPNNSSAYFNRAGTDGAIVNFRKDGTTVGNIGCPDGANGSQLVIAAGTGGTNTGVGLRFTSFTVHNIIPCYDDGSSADNHIDLGNSGARFDDIYATNGTIQTSDRNEKQDIQALTDAEQRVATACKGLIRRFRWQDAVEEKGDDARYHFGVIAQDLQDAFTAEGLDAGDYGMFISSTWTDDDGNEQTRLGVRYNELLAFIITTL